MGIRRRSHEKEIVFAFCLLRLEPHANLGLSMQFKKLKHNFDIVCLLSCLWCLPYFLANPCFVEGRINSEVGNASGLDAHTRV